MAYICGMEGTVPAHDELALLREEYRGRWHIIESSVRGYYLAAREPQRAIRVEAVGADGLRAKIKEADQWHP